MSVCAYGANNNVLTMGNWPGCLDQRIDLAQFYNHILAAHPRLIWAKPRQRQASEWNQYEWLARWQAGETGLPLVDAGMRQPTPPVGCTTGCVWWVQRNTCLLIGVKVSGTYVNLVDGDLAANNGGWQWSASNGHRCRALFPHVQPHPSGGAFDPTGAFVRSQIPELAKAQGKSIFTPGSTQKTRLSQAGD